MKTLYLPWLCLLVCLTTVSAVRADVVVCVGPETVNETVTDWNTPGTVYQCLLSDADQVARLQDRIGQAGAQGKVSARRFDGVNLPYIDNTVNRLLVSTAVYHGTEEELLRVLTPGGVALVGEERIVKPWPEEIDDWSHYHHDPAGTMVGGDRVVGPPRGLQWIGDPKWLRNHDFMSSMHAMVTSGGRVFYILDEGLRNHIFLPSDWKLIARDAFNGTVLWKQPLKDWHPQNWPLKSGPGDLPRRIVATPDVVYATAGLIEPLTAFDARTGEILRTYEGTDATVEVICDNDTLFLLTDPGKMPVGFRGEATNYGEIKRANSFWAWTDESSERKVLALDAKSGKIRWQHTSKAAPLTLTVTDNQVFFHNGAGLVALDRTSGEVQWNSDPAPVRNVPTGGTLRVAYSDGVAVFANGVAMTAFDARNGKALWEEKLQKTSHHCPEDLFIIGGRIWSPNTGRPQENGTHYVVFDLHTGEVAQDFIAQNIKGFPMHPRCYPSRATERFIMTNGMGTEFYEVGGATVDVNNTVRGSCIYGIMPANGLLYKPADSCACYYQSKLEWFLVLAPKAAQSTPPGPLDRLEKGPAFGKLSLAKAAAADWPMYRGDKARSGSNPTPAPTKPKQAWSLELGGKLTQPVVVGERVFVAQVDEHVLHAVDAQSGSSLWQFTAGGRIDSSPTYYHGSLLFGSTDGYVYCLRADDGQMAWRYLAAPTTRQHVAFQQLESVWPVHGSVMVEHDTVYALAGRNMFFDGGLRLALLDPATGAEQSVRQLDQNDPQTGLNLQTLIDQKYMPVANADLFSSNGENLFMQSQKFDLQGNRLNLAPVRPGSELPEMDEDLHLFCQTGFLDANWFHRSYWLYGSNCGEGWGDYAKYRHLTPAGRIMAVDQEKAYSFRADPLGNMLHPRQTYAIYAEVKRFETPPTQKSQRRTAPTTNPNLKWAAQELGMLVTGMAIGGNALAVAGPPDVADESQMFGFLPGADDDINRQLQEQEAAWNGQHGGVLQVLSTDSGERLARLELDTFPMFDGLVVAGGQLYVSMLDGTVRSYR